MTPSQSTMPKRRTLSVDDAAFKALEVSHPGTERRTKGVHESLDDLGSHGSRPLVKEEVYVPSVGLMDADEERRMRQVRQLEVIHPIKQSGECAASLRRHVEFVKDAAGVVASDFGAGGGGDEEVAKAAKPRPRVERNDTPFKCTDKKKDSA